MNESIRYEDYEGMLWKEAHKVARKFNALNRLDEIKAEADYLFCLALKSYNAELASFSTQLYYRLKRLSAYTRKMLCVHGRFSAKAPVIQTVAVESDEEFKDERFRSTIEEVADKELSANASRMISFLLALDPEKLQALKDTSPCRSVVRAFYKESKAMTVIEAREAWQECRSWYRTHKEFVACSTF
jgi:hypothetical protein